MCGSTKSCIRVYRTALDAIPMGGHAESSVIGRSHRLGMSPEELVYGRRVFLAGVQVRDGTVLELARRLRDGQFVDTADKLEQAWSQEAKQVALETDDRQALLSVLVDGPDELAELRSVLLQEHERNLGGGH